MPQQINASDASIKQLQIHSSTGRYELLPHFVELNIYEDIYASSITADITLIDSVNLPYNLALVGQETLDINIALEGFDEGGLTEHLVSIKPPPLHVNSLDNRIHVKPKLQGFSLSMISEQYMSSAHSKVSKSYFDMTIGEMVEDIYSVYLDDRTEEEKKNKIRGLFVEDTERTERLIIPNLRPIDAINWLSKRAVQSNDFGVNYLFFETLNGTRFVSLNYLIKDSVPTFKFVIKPRTDDPSSVEHLSSGTIKVNKFSFLKHFDRNELIENGVYSSKLITHDIVTKTIEEHDYDGWSQWPEIYHLGDYPPLTDSEIETKSSGVTRTSFAPPGAIDFPNDSKRMSGQVDGHVEFYPKHDNMYSQNANDEYDNEVEAWRQRRRSHTGIHDGLNILIEINGISGLSVGQIVELELPSTETSEKEDASDSLYDKFLSGNYMVTAIQHIFSSLKATDPKVNYKMKVELSRDGMDEKISTRKSRKEI